MASKTNRPPKKILQSINCFVQTSNGRLKCGTVKHLTNVATFLAVADPKTALPSWSFATRHRGSLPETYLDLVNIPVIANEVKQST
jgi:hypothetical protein